MEPAARPKSTSNEQYRLLINGVIDYAIYMLDSEGFVASWNPGAQRFKGYSESEILGHHFSQFYTEEDRRAGLPDRALQIATREGMFESEGWRVRKDGTRFWAHVVIDPIRDSAGHLTGFAKITRDLTERKDAEADRRRSDEQFRLLVQGVSDYAIYMLDLEGRVSSWNLGAQRIKGYLAAEVLGEHFSKFYTEQDRQAGLPQEAIKTAAQEGRFEKEGWRVRKDGTRFWANAIIDAIHDESGTLIGFAKVTRDMTERKEAQHALETARDALFQTQKMDAIGRLTGGIAHDFNNLLMAVLSSLELLRKRVTDDPKTVTLLDNATAGARRGVSLTQRMLAFARRQDLKPEPVDVPLLVHGMTDLLQRTLDPSLTIETHFPLALPPAQVDANQLESALLNLTVNARDAMPDGGSIVIAARSEVINTANDGNLKAGRYVCISVTDTGEGMDEVTLARAAEPFFTTKGVGKGTGLGLSMVHGIAEQSGGRLILKSRKNQGTTAELLLPEAQEKPIASAHRRQADTQSAEEEMRPLVVLAVDDDGLILMNTTAMLEELGHTALAATSGKEALDILRRDRKVDLVVTDQAMPNMTGAQLVGAIKMEWPNLPVILATGYADLPPGANPKLPKLAKPFSERELAAAVTRALGLGQMENRRTP